MRVAHHYPIPLPIMNTAEYDKGIRSTVQGKVRSDRFEIMVIDDNPGILKLLSGILQSKGYRVRTSLTGQLALQSVAERVPDLVLLDVKMPEMGGFEICRRLKSERHSRDIPIIFISALDETSQKIEGFAVGGVDYITKPFQDEEVLARIRTHLQLRELSERLEQKVAERTVELTQVNQILRQEIEQRHQTELALQKARDNLEQLVEKRTAELSVRNRQLIVEIDRHRNTEKALRESEVKYRTIFETTASATMIVENDGIISLVNTEFENLTGYTKTQIEGKKKWTEFVSEEDLERMQEYHSIRRIDPKAVPRNYECRAKGKDGKLHHIFVTVAMMPGTDKSVASFLDISRLKHIEKNLRESESRLRYLSSRLLAAQETERQRISMEIHDELGQNLAFLKLQLSTVAGKLRKDQASLKAEVLKMLEFTDNMIEEMRRISRDLSPTIVQDLKLCRAIKWMLHDFNQHTGIAISHTIIDIDALFDSRKQIIIYRIFQEALNNIRKHARADQIEVTICKQNHKVKIAIKDNGIGFNLDDVRQQNITEKGMGITSLEERTRMLGGGIDIITAEGKGTSLCMTIPVTPERGDT